MLPQPCPETNFFFLYFFNYTNFRFLKRNWYLTNSTKYSLYLTVWMSWEVGWPSSLYHILFNHVLVPPGILVAQCIVVQTTKSSLSEGCRCRRPDFYVIWRFEMKHYILLIMLPFANTLGLIDKSAIHVFLSIIPRYFCLQYLQYQDLEWVHGWNTTTF